MNKDKTIHHEIGEMIRQARVKKGFSQAKLSEMLGYQTPQFVSLIERGLAKAPPPTLGALTVFLGISEKRVIQLLMQNYHDSLVAEIHQGMSASKLK